MTRTLGAILAGGRSARMGTDKATVEVRDTPMIDLVGRAMDPLVERLVVCGSPRDGWECWPDSVHAGGPLAGVTTALSRAESRRALVVAVDHPFVQTETLRRLLDIESDLPVVPVDHDGTRQVTCAVYPTTISREATDEARSGGSIQTLLDRVSFRPVTPDEWSSWGEDGRSWFSVDTQDDLRTGLMSYG